MGIPQVTVGLGNQNAAVLVAQPACDDLEVDPGLNGVAAKVVAHIVMGEDGQVGLAACVAHQGLGIVDRNDPALGDRC